MVAGKPNSDPYACTVSTLSTEPLPTQVIMFLISAVLFVGFKTSCKLSINSFHWLIASIFKIKAFQTKINQTKSLICFYLFARFLIFASSQNSIQHIFLKRFIYLYFLCTSVLHACIAVHYMHAWYPWRRQRAVDPLEVELQMIVSCLIGPENGALVL